MSRKQVAGLCKHLEVSEVMKKEQYSQHRLAVYVEKFEQVGCYDCSGGKSVADKCKHYEPRMWTVL